MKKFILFLVVLLCIAHLVNAKLKLYVYEKDGEVTSFEASEVDSISFTAPSDYPIELNGEEELFDYVDMGLSVRWATCNLGATTPEEYGDYFAWGEVETKDFYDLNNYKWAASVTGMVLKYCTNSFLGNVDNKIQLEEPEDDAASAICENRWRIPTEYEFNELINNCSITWTSSNGVYGLEFISNKNGNSIFIPAAGYFYYDEKDGGYFGYYWTSSLDLNDSTRAKQFAFNEDWNKLSSSTRYFGQPIRPVFTINN